MKTREFWVNTVKDNDKIVNQCYSSLSRPVDVRTYVRSLTTCQRPSFDESLPKSIATDNTIRWCSSSASCSLAWMLNVDMCHLRRFRLWTITCDEVTNTIANWNEIEIKTTTNKVIVTLLKWALVWGIASISIQYKHTHYRMSFFVLINFF